MKVTSTLKQYQENIYIKVTMKIISKENSKKRRVLSDINSWR